jgi:excisionase family DNA binding protein
MAAKTYSTREAAKALGVSHQTLYSWIESGHIVAPKQIQVGRSTIRLWTTAEIERARKFKGKLKRGPQPRSNK